MSGRVLFVTPEFAPLNKVGGLGDVGHGLVHALRRDGWDVRVLIPGYPPVLAACQGLEPATRLVDHHREPGRLLAGRARELDVPFYIADFPHHFGASASPYGEWNGHTPADAWRFSAFADAAVEIARGSVGWRPDVVHCNDWTTGLIPARLHLIPGRPGTLFTIHNLAHQGLFPRSCFDDLGLPPALWALDGLEFHGQMSFIKGGLVYADRLNTVSPSYAGEILSERFGCGLDGLLRHRADRLTGILNGIDEAWNPAADSLIPHAFDVDDLHGKARCKADLQARLNIAVDPHALVIGVVGRLAHQKGIDLVADAWDQILALGAQIVLLGSGDPDLAAALCARAQARPGRSSVNIIYHEALAHRIMAGADLLLMPSRFEPCGLTQMFALRYGTVPVVARTGGLADTVVDATDEALALDLATGFLFDPGSVPALLHALERARRHFSGSHWQRIQRAGMRQDFGWKPSAAAYGALYRAALSDRHTASIS